MVTPAETIRASWVRWRATLPWSAQVDSPVICDLPGVAVEYASAQRLRMLHASSLGPPSRVSHLFQRDAKINSVPGTVASMAMS